MFLPFYVDSVYKIYKAPDLKFADACHVVFGTCRGRSSRTNTHYTKAEIVHLNKLNMYLYQFLSSKSVFVKLSLS